MVGYGVAAAKVGYVRLDQGRVWSGGSGWHGWRCDRSTGLLQLRLGCACCCERHSRCEYRLRTGYKLVLMCSARRSGRSGDIVKLCAAVAPPPDSQPITLPPSIPVLLCHLCFFEPHEGLSAGTRTFVQRKAFLEVWLFFGRALKP